MPTSAAHTIPNVNNHWNTPVPFPRSVAARHSARYSGTTTPINPALTPCSSRPNTSGPYPCDRAMTGMLTTNINPLKIISGLRPIQSASRPANSVEITLPRSTAATTIDNCPAFSREVASRYGKAPAIIPTSTPYNSPPSPATSSKNRLYPDLLWSRAAVAVLAIPMVSACGATCNVRVSTICEWAPPESLQFPPGWRRPALATPYNQLKRGQPLSFNAFSEEVKDFLNRFNSDVPLHSLQQLHWAQKEPRLAGGNEPGRGHSLRGAWRKPKSMSHCMLLQRKNTDLLQLFICEKPLFDISRALAMPDAGFI